MVVSRPRVILIPFILAMSPACRKTALFMIKNLILKPYCLDLNLHSIIGITLGNVLELFMSQFRTYKMGENNSMYCMGFPENSRFNKCKDLVHDT